jgi:hypothetical protein
MNPSPLLSDPIARSRGARMAIFGSSRGTPRAAPDTTRAATKPPPSRRLGRTPARSTARRPTTKRAPDPIDVWSNEGGASSR